MARMLERSIIKRQALGCARILPKDAPAGRCATTSLLFVHDYLNERIDLRNLIVKSGDTLEARGVTDAIAEFIARTG
jgi:hypothetical protein